MALKDILKGGTAKTITSLEQKATEAQELVNVVGKEVRACALEAEDGGSDAAKRYEAKRKALLDAENGLQRITGALLEAREREKTREQDEAEAAISKGWKETEDLAKKRRKAAIEAQVAVDNAAAAFKKLIEINGQMFQACPNTVGARAGFGIGDLDGAFRLYLVKKDFAWAQTGWVWGPERITPLVEVVETSNAIMLANKDKKDAA